MDGKMEILQIRHGFIQILNAETLSKNQVFQFPTFERLYQDRMQFK